MGESGENVMYLNIGMSKKQNEKYILNSSFGLNSELRDLNVRNVFLDNIFVFVPIRVDKLVLASHENRCFEIFVSTMF